MNKTTVIAVANQKGGVGKSIAKLKKLSQRLTAAQFRRYYLHVVAGMSQRKIAKQEGISPVAVSKSIRKARAAAITIAGEVKANNQNAR